ncbi:hypothetical protein NMG60_11008677 [Bertholletia excelsa]
MKRSYSGTCFRSVKRKFDEFEELVLPNVARVEIENERDALREMVDNQQKTIKELTRELEEERNASSSAANEAMSMILRLQREKAEIEMEARQFKRFTEEKNAHDQREMSEMEDMLYKKEQTIQSLQCEVQAYKHRMMSFGLTESEADGEVDAESHKDDSPTARVRQFEPEPPTLDYPPLKCNLNETHFNSDVEHDVADIEKYAFGETPPPRDHLKDLEYRINQLERSPKQVPPDGELSNPKDVVEKVIVGQSPRRPRHLRRMSTSSSNSFFTVKELGQDFTHESPRPYGSFRKMDYSQTEDYSSNLRKVDDASDVGDDMSDRVYTIDSIYEGMQYNSNKESKNSVVGFEDYLTTPRDFMNVADIGDPDVRKLYMKLQALEADRESMRQAIISTRTDKAQLVLLKEIAQHFCKEMSTTASMPKKKPTPVGNFSITSVCKVSWGTNIQSFLFLMSLLHTHTHTHTHVINFRNKFWYNLCMILSMVKIQPLVYFYGKQKILVRYTFSDLLSIFEFS